MGRRTTRRRHRTRRRRAGNIATVQPPVNHYYKIKSNLNQLLNQ